MPFMPSTKWEVTTFSFPPKNLLEKPPHKLCNCINYKLPETNLDVFPKDVEIWHGKDNSSSDSVKLYKV